MFWQKGSDVPNDLLSSSKVFGFDVVHVKDEDVLRLIKQGKYENESVEVVSSWHKDGGIGFDIGANIGLFSFGVISKSKASGGRIFAFEPNPYTYARLALSIQANRLEGKITALPIALADSMGIKTFRVHRPESSSGDGLLDTRRAGPVKDTFVVSMTMDILVEQLGIKKLDWIKIDVEGAELLVLQGGESTLKNLKPKILFEAYPDNLLPYGFSPEELFTFFYNCDYEIFLPDGNQLGEDAFIEMVNDKKCVNFIGKEKRHE